MLIMWEIQWEIKEVRGTLGDSSGKGNAHESMANFTKLANCTALGAIGGRSQGASMLGGLRPGLGCPPEHGSDSESEPCLRREHGSDWESEPCSSGAARAAGVAAAQYEPSGSGSGAGGTSRPRRRVCLARGRRQWRWQTPDPPQGRLGGPGALRRKTYAASGRPQAAEGGPHRCEGGGEQGACVITTGAKGGEGGKPF